MTLEERIWRRFQQALATYRLIDDGDRILIGLSGGKDSLLLTELLARRQRIHRPQFSVEAIHVRMENVSYAASTDYLQNFCDSHNVPLHIAQTRFDAPAEGQHAKPACFLCSWMRRKTLFNEAQRLGCNKIALGHHQDDIIHTTLMNLFFQSHFSPMPVRLTMRKMPISIIRPLCLEHEDDIRLFSESKGYEKLLKTCPYEHASNRTTVRRLFDQMEKLSPEVRHSFWSALEREGRLLQ